MVQTMSIALLDRAIHAPSYNRRPHAEGQMSMQDTQAGKNPSVAQPI
jgi:hypothetical protein